MSSNGRAEERRRDRRAWKAQRKILSKKRARRAVRRIICSGYTMKAEREAAAAGRRGAHGDPLAADLLEAAALPVADPDTPAVVVPELEPGDGEQLAGIPNVPTVTVADQEAIHAEHHYGPMAACPNVSCQWATMMGGALP